MGCFVSGADEATLCYLVVRAVPCLLEGATRRAPLTRARSETGGAFVGDGNSKYNACERLCRRHRTSNGRQQDSIVDLSWSAMCDRYGGKGGEGVLGCFVSGADEATLCYLVVRAVPCLLEGAARRAPSTRARSETGGAFVGDSNSKYNACERLCRRHRTSSST